MSTMTHLPKGMTEIVDQHRRLYAGNSIEKRLKSMIGASPPARLSQQDTLDILRQSRSIFFDTHIEVVSGHHTGTYLRFESIAAYPHLIQAIAKDMAEWISSLNTTHKVDGIVAPASDARLLVESITSHLQDRVPLRVVLAPFNPTTGRIGTEVPPDSIQPGEHFLAFNDVTTRGNCVSKLGQIVKDHRGNVVGMMVFARRDSGQFPYMDELTERYPFYYGASLNMPQWEASQCPLCQAGDPLYSWREMPFL